MRKRLIEGWPGLYVPPIPPKQFMVHDKQGNLSQVFIHGRRKLLEGFLRSTADRSYMYESMEFQKFLRGDAPFEKALSQIPSPTLFEIATNYSEFFSDYRRPVPKDTEIRLEQYSAFFRELLVQNAKIRRQSKSTAELFATFSRNYWPLCTNLNEYEPSSGSSDSEGNRHSVFQFETREVFLNPFEVLQNLLKVERLEIDSMLEAFSVKKTYEATLKRLQAKLTTEQKALSKLASGKKTLGSLFSTKPKIAFISSLNESLEATKGDIQQVELILNIMTVRLLEYEVPAFLALRAKKYRQSIKNFGRVSAKEFEEVIKALRA